MTVHTSALPASLTAPDIARERGWNRVRAWRWLQRMKKRHGESVVRGAGRETHISRKDYELLLARERASLAERIASLEESSAEHDARLDALAREVSALRRAG